MIAQLDMENWKSCEKSSLDDGRLSALGSAHIGTLVKLVRAPMPGPLVPVLSLFGRRKGGRHPWFSHMVPWFIIGFLLLLTLR